MSDREYDAYVRAKVLLGLEQSRDRAAMIPIEQIWRDLGLEDQVAGRSSVRASIIRRCRLLADSSNPLGQANAPPSIKARPK